MAIVSYVPKEARTTQAHCDRYHVIIRGYYGRRRGISAAESTAPTVFQDGRIVR
ncbi:hypothetical protein HMPREF1522_0669 [Actinomyces sp. ICM54]|nr:hypothetical protein HMPREF1522_0669 [Actinomyces sp. ICM54]